MGHEPTYGTRGVTISHALLFLIGARNPNDPNRRQINDGSVGGRATDVHHDAVASPGLMPHTGRRRMQRLDDRRTARPPGKQLLLA